MGASKVTTPGGLGGDGDLGGYGGAGGKGRIQVGYCESYTGESNPVSLKTNIICHFAEQEETEPYTTTRLAIPESITTSKTYAVQYGRRLIFSEAGDQTSVIPIPAGLLDSAELDLLISEVGVGSLAIAMDVGNDGLTDYIWSGDVSNLKSLENIEVKETINRWWLNSSKQLSGEISIPVKISLSKPGQVLITDLQVTKAASAYGSIRMESGNYSSVLLDYKANSTNGKLSVALDIGDDGTIDDGRRIETPLNPQRITSANLAVSVNAYLSGSTSFVDVPVRIFFTGCDDVEITNYHSTKTGTLDISTSATDIVLPGYEPVETSIVPVSGTIHNNGNLPTGYFTASFYASTAEFGDWYIGSALYPALLPGQAATREIQWNTSGFSGSTTVKVIADPYERIKESIEDNNLAQKTIYIRTRPDVSTTGITFSNGEPVLNEQIEVTLDVSNLGETDAGQMTTTLYDGEPENGGELIGDQITAIPATNNAQLTLPWQPVKTGWHRLYVQTDTNQQVDEFDEVNNTYWQDVYVGLAGPLLIDSGSEADAAYSVENGFGFVDTNLPDVTTTCGSGSLPEETIRLDPEGRILYRFDHLLPGHFYHLDVTMVECDSAGRLQYIMVDENRFTDPIDLEDGEIHKLSLRLDPAFYSDRSITVAIATDGIDGAVISEVNLHDIDYRYADSGGSADPQYPGNQGYGWLEGTASTTYGALPYQSLRIDLSNNDMRYRFDDLDPNKKYNVHFTFWQPQDKGRIMDILVDGAYSGLTVDTSDYLKHQEVISIPSDAYQTDGSIIVSMLRTNSVIGAMVNEIALEEETSSAIYSPNKTPVANAGPDQSMDTNVPVTLDGSGSSDPDGNTPLTYAWTQTAGILVTLSDNTAANPTFTAPGDPSTLMFSLIVTDSLGKSSVADKVKITVNNRVPVANAGPDQSVNVLSTVTLDGSGSSDPDGDIPFAYNWTQTAGASVTLNNQTTVNPTFTAPIDPGTLKFSLVVTDSFGLNSAPDEVVITTTNQGPVVSDIPDQEILEGGNFTPISLDEYVSDVDDPDSTITWSYSGNTNLNVSIINRVAIITAKTTTWTGSETITFKATDPGGLYDEDTVTFSILPPNEAPILSSISPTYAYTYMEDLPLVLHVFGENFIDGSLIRWDGVDRTDTVFVSETEISIDLTEVELSNPGAVEISVFTPAPGGGVSETIEFVIVGISPTYEEKLTSSKVKLDWGDIPEATAYKIKVSTKPDFSVLLLNMKTTTSEQFLDTFLAYDKTYYWKVRPIFGDVKGSWSPVFRFVSMDQLASPSLVSPPHKEYVNSPVALEWTPVENAVQYKVVVATDPAFVTKVAKETLAFTTTSVALPAGKYFWRVRAIDAYGAKGPWSEVRIFKILAE